MKKSRKNLHTKKNGTKTSRQSTSRDTNIFYEYSALKA